MTDENFQRLATLYLEDAISEAELEQLNRELAGSPERVQQFNDLRLLTGLIHEHGRSGVDQEAELETKSLSKRMPSRPESARPRASSYQSGILVATMLVCAALGVLLWRQNANAQRLGNSVAKLEYVSENTEFSEDHVMPRQAADLLTKGWVRLDRGVVRILFHSGANVEIEGPAVFGIDSPMRSYLDFGRVRVHAPESARDFVVATEGMEVVDLGTRFELAVNQETRESNVTVSEGLVDLHLGARGTERRIQPLEAGFTAQVDAAGDILTLQQTQIEKGATPQLVAHWKLDELPSGKTESIPGVAGSAVHLHERGFIDVSDWAEELGQTEAFTISAWVRNPSDRIAILFSLSDGTAADRVQFHLNRRHLVFGWQMGAHYDAVNGKVDRWEADRWYHVAVTVRNGVIRLFRDGEPIGSSSVGHKIGTRIPTLTSVQNPTQAYLGKLNDSSSGDLVAPQFFGGAIDDVQIYAKAVAPKNIRFLFENPGETWNPSVESH